jgi:hypothetical protein
LAAIVLAVALMNLPALASEGPWQFSSVRGLVVYLQDGKWQELDPDQPLGTTTLRTLRSGRVSLEGQNVRIDMGPDAALKFTSLSDGSAASIDQYEGSISVSAPRGGGTAPVVIRAGKITLSRITGGVDVSVADSVVSVIVKSGSVSAVSAGGKTVQLAAGDYETDSTGVLLASASQSRESTAAADDQTDSANTTTPPVGPGNNNGNGPSSNNSGGNGNGNGNGTGGNSAGGNNNGNGNGGNNGGGNGKGNGKKN